MLLVLALVELTACVRSSQGISRALPASGSGPYVVIGHMEHRDRIVTIKTGDQGTVYSVTNKKDGKILFENLTAEQLKSAAPEIHGFIEAAEAGSASIFPDASLRK